MIGYALRRLAVALPIIVIVACVTFGLVYLMPGDPAAALAGDNATAERIAEVRHEMGFDRPFFVQFGDWMISAAQGDFGKSFHFGVPVTDLLAHRMTVTFSIVIVGWIIAVLIGVPAGLIAGMRPGSITDRIVTGLTTLGISVPSFWLAMVLISIFAISLRWFDATGYAPISDGVGPWLYKLILPGLAVAATSAADIARQTRSSVATVVGQDFIRTNHAMGVKGGSIRLRHVLRNAGIPVATVAGLQIERLIGAAVVVELLFAMPGLGDLTLTAVNTQDIPSIQGVVVLVAAIVIVVNLIVDLSYAWINPKLRKR